ncbi:MAG: hypothetical protein HRT67_07085 [Flavobacteriaceae bacterium]|nr:hypothetical protein [Flavobacteriaceae bacterium]
MVEVVKYSVGNINAGLLPKDIESEQQQKAKVLIEGIRKTRKELVIEEFEPIGNPKKEIHKIIALWNANILIIGHHK